jgi:hypothetical protein
LEAPVAGTQSTAYLCDAAVLTPVTEPKGDAPSPVELRVVAAA